MYKKVDIKSAAELALYLVNKGDLYVDDNMYDNKGRIFFDCDELEVTPFKYESKNIVVNAAGVWNTKAIIYYKKVEWFESIPEGKSVPCYVSDVDSSDKTVADSICKYSKDSKHPYKSLSSLWKYATPIPADDLWMPES